MPIANMNTTNRRHYLCLILFSMLFFTGCDAEMQRTLEAAGSKADGRVSNLAGAHDSRFVNGEMDYGYTISFTVTNDGESGIVTIMPWLSSSEGEWSRTQKLSFAEGESMALNYFFQEPTINSENLQYGVRISP